MYHSGFILHVLTHFIVTLPVSYYNPYQEMLNQVSASLGMRKLCNICKCAHNMDVKIYIIPRI